MDETKIAVMVRDRDGLRNAGSFDSAFVMKLVGSLSANPTTLYELERACERYHFEPKLSELDWNDGPADAAGDLWVLVDLSHKCVVGGPAMMLPEIGRFEETRDDGSSQMIWVNLPYGWGTDNVDELAEALDSLPELREPLDARAILYGLPFAADIAQRTLAFRTNESLPDRFVQSNIYRSEVSPTDEDRELANRWYELTAQIHADWLTTERDDLGGLSPRPFLHQDREWVESELQNRASQWSRQGSAPPALDKDTWAYCYGPLGVHEVVVYFEFCRHAIEEAWRQIFVKYVVDEQELAEAIYQRTQEWLQDEIAIDGRGPAPNVIIESERRLLPLVEDGPLFDDCENCRVMSESPTPTFTWFDGHNLDLDGNFVFSLCKDQKEWDFGPGQYFVEDEGQQDLDADSQVECDSASGRTPD